MKEEYIIEARNLKQYFRINRNFTVKAVDGISFGIRRGEAFGLVGETGCGKSTVARTLSGIYQPSSGSVFYKGTEVTGPHASRESILAMQKQTQMIFQDSAASLNPRMRVRNIILEPLRIHKMLSDKAFAEKKLGEILQSVGLSERFLDMRPGELSGGQRQRTAIARSLMLEPEFIIADEPIASLDLSIQAQILSLFQTLQREKQFSFLFISHDLSAVRFLCSRTGVMFRGKLLELADTEELFAHPLHPYTQSLLSSIHSIDPLREKKREIFYYDRDMVLGEAFEEVSPGHWLLR